LIKDPPSCTAVVSPSDRRWTKPPIRFSPGADIGQGRGDQGQDRPAPVHPGEDGRQVLDLGDLVDEEIGRGGHFGLDLLVRAPDWLGPAATRAATVPGAEQWLCPTTFVQTLVDMKNAANVIPGQFEARGHDYRADLARFIREVYRLPATDAQLDAAKAAKNGRAGGSVPSSPNAASRS